MDVADVGDADAVDVGVVVAADALADGVALGVVDVATRLPPQLVTSGITSNVSQRVRILGTVEHRHNRTWGQVLGERAGRVIDDPDVQHGRCWLRP